SSDLEDEAKDDAVIWGEIDDEEAAEKAATNGKAADEPAADTDNEAKIKDDEAKAATAAAAAAAKPPSKTPKEVKDALWAGASPEQRAAFDTAQSDNTSLQHQLDSEKGRTKTFRRQLSDVTGQLDKVAAKPPEKEPKDEGASEDGKPDNWDSLSTEYPEVAGPVGKRLDAIEANQAVIAKRDEAAAEDANEKQLSLVTEQTRLLVVEHSDWLEVATTPEFNAWLDDQPRKFRDAALLNAKEIVDAKEAGEIITRFKASRSDQDDNPAGPGNDDDKSNDQETVTSLAEKRARQLEAAAGTRPKGPGAIIQGIPEDGTDKEIWDGFDKKEAREAAQA
ncbi:MAG: hypothetical protein IIC02_04095, partial [Planctomycetes bacterium]|nr:hypothetical protein [Planctomycetota bacterium]